MTLDAVPRIWLGVIVVSVSQPAGAGAAELAQAQWRAHATPILDIASENPIEEFVLAYPVGAARLPTGVVAIADGMGSMIHFVDQAGQLIRSAGGRGEGPGEYGRIAWMATCGQDSVFVHDIDLNRITVLDSHGRLSRTFRLPAGPPAVAVACSPAGIFALLAIGADQQTQYDIRTGEGPHMRGPLTLVDDEGTLIRELGTFPVGEGRPLGKQSRLALSASRIYVGTNDSAFVDAFTLDGRLSGTLPLRVQARAPNRDNYEWAVEVRAMQFANADFREGARRMLEAIPMPAQRPPYTALFTDPDGNLWAQLSMPGDGETWLRGVDPAGSLIADVRIAKDLRVFEVGRDYILAAYEDPSGEPHVAMYRVQRVR